MGAYFINEKDQRWAQPVHCKTNATKHPSYHSSIIYVTSKLKINSKIERVWLCNGPYPLLTDV